MSLAGGSVWSAVLSGGNFLLFNHLVKNESITAFLWEDSHFMWVYGHLSPKVWRHRLADPARNQKPNRFKVLAPSFEALVCVSLSTGAPETQLPCNVGSELSPFSISIWMCPDDLPVSSVRLQLQQQLLSPSLFLHAAHPPLCCFSLTFYQICIIFLWDHIFYENGPVYSGVSVVFTLKPLMPS